MCPLSAYNLHTMIVTSIAENISSDKGATMQLYLTATAQQEPAAAQLTRSIAHLCYRVGPEGRLMRNAAPKGGFMVLTDAGNPSFHHSDALISDVLQECRAGHFSGVVADFETVSTEDSQRFLTHLTEELRHQGKRLYVPERLAPLYPNASVLFCTALSGGNFQVRLRKAARAFGARRIALDTQWLRMEFPLPCPSGRGRLLGTKELSALITQQKPVSLFSSELCANYFTYCRGGEHRFVLYDTAETILKKLRFGAELGCGCGFLFCGEIEDLPGLMQRIKKEKIL